MFQIFYVLNIWYIPTILLPTRITASSKTLIDNTFISVSKYNYLAGNLVYNISDHLPLFIFLQGAFLNSESKIPIFKSDWNKFNYENFILDYFDIDWDLVIKLELGDTNVSFESFYTQISSLVDQHLPQIRLTNKQKKFLSKPWITAGLRKSIYKRDKLFRHFTKSSDRILKSNYRKEYKTYRNYIVSLSRKSKSNYHSNYFHNHINNIQKIWQGVKNIISTNSSNKSPISLSVHDNISFDPTLFSNTFNDYFCTIADTIRANIPHSTKYFSRFLKQSGSFLESFLLIQYLLLK